MKEEIIKTYDKASNDYGYNSNSLHKLGLDARKLEEAATKQILEVLSLTNYDVIYTSGNAESYTTLVNNIKGSILTDNKEILEICKEKNIDIRNKDNVDKNTFISVEDENFYNGKVDHINIDLNKKYSDLNKYDFITIEDDIPFFGILIKKKNIDLKNLIHGGKSTTKYRSGTSVTPLIASFAKLVKLKYKK
ncbi:MAG: aminotransferase class V-fold PLP-dependent enzyme [Bacilli bacterium]|nr:aminotransferase class V-fold PLP-dependent enzyme [Bacilli bacterium]